MKKEYRDEVLGALNDVGTALTKLWWRFFDWVAVVSWVRLILTWLLILILLQIVGLHALSDVMPPILLAAIISKVLARGKRRSDLVAKEASEKARVEALERHVAEAKMTAMQAQIEPHFLFNTLSSVEMLIELDPPRAAKMQRTLIRYLRAALPKMREGATGTTLGEQIELSKAYLEIMQVRMEERLKFELHIPEGLRSAQFPSMMLQTLVENCIQHGLEPKVEGGTIRIDAEIFDGQLQVTVTDDGIGFGASNQAGTGVGLANIRERLKMLFNGAAELLIEVPPNGGTRVRINLPYAVVRKPVIDSGIDLAKH